MVHLAYLHTETVSLSAAGFHCHYHCLRDPGQTQPNGCLHLHYCQSLYTFHHHLMQRFYPKQDCSQHKEKCGDPSHGVVLHCGLTNAVSVSVLHLLAHLFGCIPTNMKSPFSYILVSGLGSSKRVPSTLFTQTSYWYNILARADTPWISSFGMMLYQFGIILECKFISSQREGWFISF